MNFMFYNCPSLLSIKDISKWNACNIKELDFAFFGCTSLTELPGITEWNINNNIICSNYMFYNCNKLNQKSDILKWKEENIKNKNGMIIKYKSYKEGNIRIFGEKFVENNKNKCYLLIDNKLDKLQEFYKVTSKQKSIILIENESITDMSYIFSDCSSLSSLPDISKWNTNNVTNMSYMFYECSSSLPDISKWNTNNVTNMS